ncbi:outer membrane beta-barrel protein [Maribacter aestuarii]|uniref:outer membrane beta-barrel protein n=1 Tax=Maribacter aestuarii TaxID=1130723 RepID=UPI00248AE582|nr:outer membrane beta-barrel protein [Maribacter aestuarii]
MMKKLLLGIFLCASVYTFAQDKKWSVEANYSIIPAEGIGGDDDIFEIGLKYRFLDFKLFNLGLSVNTGFSTQKSGDDLEEFGFESKTTNYYIQPRIFSEIKLPGIPKLKPSIALGYSVVNTDSFLILNGEDLSSDNTNSGFNANFGISYDITGRFFVQAQYDFISLKVRDDIFFNGEAVRTDFTDKLNNIKIGVGLRF